MGNSSMHDLINITVQTQTPTLVNTLEVGTLFIDYLGRICTITKKGLFYAFLGEPANQLIDGEYYVTPIVLYDVVEVSKPTKTTEIKPPLSETLELSGLKLDGDELCLSEVHLPDTLG